MSWSNEYKIGSLSYFNLRCSCLQLQRPTTVPLTLFSCYEAQNKLEIQAGTLKPTSSHPKTSSSRLHVQPSQRPHRDIHSSSDSWLMECLRELSPAALGSRGEALWEGHGPAGRGGPRKEMLSWRGGRGVSEPGGWAAVKAQLFPPPAAPTLSIMFSGEKKKKNPQGQQTHLFLFQLRERRLILNASCPVRLDAHFRLRPSPPPAHTWPWVGPGLVVTLLPPWV